MSFIQAGNEAVRSALKARAAAERNKPKYDKFGKQAIADQTAQELLTAEINARARKDGLITTAEEKVRDLDRDAKEFVMDQKRSARMAGLLAGGVAMIGTAGFMSQAKTEENPMIAMYEKNKKDGEDAMRDLQQKIDEMNTKAETQTVSEKDEQQTSMDLPEIPPVDGQTSSSSSSKKDGQLLATAALAPAAAAAASNGWSKLQRVIRYGEGTLGEKGYNTQFTGTQFSDLSKHPRQLRSSGKFTSDAAGAYQFLSTTWDEAKQALGLKDFSKESQDKAGRYLTERRGVNPDKEYKSIDEFREAMDKLAPEWASLPYSKVSPTGFGRGSSYYGQGGKTLEDLWRVYNQG